MYGVGGSEGHPLIEDIVTQGLLLRVPWPEFLINE